LVRSAGTVTNEMTGAMAWTKSNGEQRRMKSEQARLTATVAGLGD